MRALSARLERLQQRLDARAAAYAPARILQTGRLGEYAPPDGQAWLIVPGLAAPEVWNQAAAAYAQIQQADAQRRELEHG